MARLEEELKPGVFPNEINAAIKRDNPAAFGDILRLLGRLVCAKRPLKWYEIQGMESIDLNYRTVDFHQRSFRKSAKELCSSLVEERSDKTIELVHVTVKAHIDRCAEELSLACLCIDYLNLPAFIVDPTAESVLQGDYSFMDYAVMFWLPHLEAGATSRTLEHETYMNDLQESLALEIG
ncbi:unnamed protein product [Clonostachys rosea]|uniref:Uncharacterized protein n=1 Tax=Bionectria ochroleuca TaxID=29856 RepID=A0ABY6TXT7_BIOOC|nr:unnamed protein product [Clonostachys rosea]